MAANSARLARSWAAPARISLHQPCPLSLDRAGHWTIVGMAHVATVGHAYFDSEPLGLPGDGAAVLGAAGLRASEEHPLPASRFESLEIPAIAAPLREHHPRKPRWIVAHDGASQDSS